MIQIDIMSVIIQFLLEKIHANINPKLIVNEIMSKILNGNYFIVKRMLIS